MADQREHNLPKRPPLQINGGSASGSFAGTQRPNWNGQNPTLDGSVTYRLLRYFNTSDFTFNAPFTFGSAPRLMPDLRGPGTDNFDISLFKNIRLLERYQIQFRAEAFNAFNRVQFGNPNTSINSSAFGVISSQQNSPRNIQWRFGSCSDGLKTRSNMNTLLGSLSVPIVLLSTFTYGSVSAPAAPVSLSAPGIRVDVSKVGMRVTEQFWVKRGPAWTLIAQSDGKSAGASSVA